MRIYELIFIVKPDIPDDEVDAAVEQCQAWITDGGGTIDKVDRWGKKNLAYEVHKYTQGHYVLIQYRLEENPGHAKEVERRLRVADAIIKFMTVRIDEELKRAEKLKAKRAARAARRPQGNAPDRPSPRSPERPEASPARPGKPEAAEPEAPTAASEEDK